MSIPPESVEVGKCYLARNQATAGGGGHSLRVRRVLEVGPNGRVRYEFRRGPVDSAHLWPRKSTTSLSSFAHQAVREVPCDWTPGVEQD